MANYVKVKALDNASQGKNRFLFYADTVNDLPPIKDKTSIYPGSECRILTKLDPLEQFSKFILNSEYQWVGIPETSMGGISTVAHDLTLIGTGANSDPLGVRISVDADNIIKRGADGGIYAEAGDYDFAPEDFAIDPFSDPQLVSLNIHTWIGTKVEYEAALALGHFDEGDWIVSITDDNGSGPIGQTNWGDIQGNIENQLDLTSILESKVGLDNLTIADNFIALTQNPITKQITLANNVTVIGGGID